MGSEQLEVLRLEEGFGTRAGAMGFNTDERVGIEDEVDQSDDDFTHMV